MAYLRSQENQVLVSCTQDDGRSWTCSEPTDLPNNSSGIDTVRPRPGTLVLALSENEGKSYPHRLLVEDGPRVFCHPALIHTSDGPAYEKYTCNRTAIRHVQLGGGAAGPTAVLSGATLRNVLDRRRVYNRRGEHRGTL